jgi:hypothetical protein
VRVLGDLADEDLLRLPQVLPEQAHVLRLLSAEVPDEEEGTERLGRRLRANPSEQVERFGIVLQHAQGGRGKHDRVLAGEHGHDLLRQRVTDRLDALGSRDERRAQVRRILEQQRAEHAPVADPDPTLLARQLLEKITLDRAKLHRPERQHTPRVQHVEEVWILLPALDRGNARLRRLCDLRV